MNTHTHYPLHQLQPRECRTPCRKTLRRRSLVEEKQGSGLVPRYLFLPSSRYLKCGEVGSDVHALTKLAIIRVGRAQVGGGGGNGAGGVDVNCNGDGDGAGKGTRMEANE